MNIYRCPAGHFYDRERYASCPICRKAKPEPESVPVKKPSAMPVGWLVCISGPERGRDYRLYPGYNDIGSNPESVVCLAFDESVSPRAAVLGYDDRMNLYSFGPSGGRMPVRVNDKMIMDAVILNPNDILTVGETALLFVPLCSQSFRWDDPDSACK